MKFARGADAHAPHRQDDADPGPLDCAPSASASQRL